MRPTPCLCLSIFLVLGISGTIGATDYRVDADASLFAVVTHRGGFASGLAHNHLIAGRAVQESLRFDRQQPEATRLTLRFRSSELSVDDWAIQQARFPRLNDLGVLDEPFTEVPEKDRRKIRRSMLGSSQLDQESFPEIRASVVEIERAAGPDRDFPFRVSLALEVAGKRIVEPVEARYTIDDRQLTVEAIGTFRFTQFGIEPYSALLGAVKNLDEFHVYLYLVARPQ